MLNHFLAPPLIVCGGAALFIAVLALAVDHKKSKLVERHKTFQAVAAAKDCELKTQVFDKITKDGHQYNRYEVYDCDGARLTWDQRRGKKADSGPDIGLVVTSGGQVGTVITP